MSEDEITLKWFLWDNPPVDGASLCHDGAMVALKASVGELPGLDLAGLGAAIKEKIEEIFDVSLSEILRGAWLDYQQIRDCADPEKHPADETIRLKLATHEIKSTHRPELEIRIGDLPPLKIRFEIELGLTLSGPLLIIRGAKIREVDVSTCQARGTVTCNGVTLLERETREIRLLGRISLGEGIAIPPPDMRPRRKAHAA
jgi:hypothetical protein